MEDGEQLKFDVITCFDVIEHFEPEDVDMYIQQVCKHLKDDGIFLATIALYSAGRHAESENTPEGLDYHKSVFPVSWWQEKFSKHMNEQPYLFSTTNRGNPANTYTCWWKKKK